MSINPVKILGVPGGALTKGNIADITVIDPKPTWTVDPQYFYSKSRNTAFEGFTLRGCAVVTILEGRIVFERITK